MQDKVMLDFVPPLSLGRGASFLLDVAVLGLALGALLIGLALHARRLAAARARERSQLDESRPLGESAHVVLTGTVDSRDVVAPVRATLFERRSEVDPTGWSEERREVAAQPFELDTQAGMVHVEPGTDALVASEVDNVSYGVGTRARVAVLEHGTTILAYGSLHRERHAFAGYRGGAEGWTLRAPRGGRLLLADAALATRYDARIRVLRSFTRAALPLWLLFHAVFSSAFLFASFAGTQVRTHLVHEDESAFRGLDVRVSIISQERIETRTDDGLSLSSDVSPDTAAFLRDTNVQSLPLLRSSWPAACYVGGEAWTSAPAIGCGLLAALIALFAVRIRYRQATPWYDRNTPRQ